MKLTNEDKLNIFDASISKVHKMIRQKMENGNYPAMVKLGLIATAQKKVRTFRQLFIEADYSIDDVNDPYIEEEFKDSVRIVYKKLERILLTGIFEGEPDDEEQVDVALHIKAKTPEELDKELHQISGMSEEQIKEMLGLGEEVEDKKLAGMTIIELDENGEVISKQVTEYDDDGNPFEPKRPLEDYGKVSVGDEVMLTDDFPLYYLCNEEGKVGTEPFEEKVEKFSGKKAVVLETDQDFPFKCNECDSTHHAEVKINFVDYDEVYYTNNKFLTKYIDVNIDNV